MRHYIDIPKSEYEHLIDEWILNERNRNILKRRLLDGITFEKLAEEFDMSPKWVQKIVYKSMDKLLKHIK